MSEVTSDDELVLEYVAECREHLATIETDLLLIEQAGASIDEQVVNRVFRAAHSIKGGAGFFDLVKIEQLAHRTENVLDLVRSGQLVPYPETVSILLLAFDKLRDLLLDYTNSNGVDIAEFISALSGLADGSLAPGRKCSEEKNETILVPNSGVPMECPAFDLDQARRGGKNIYVIEYDLIHDLQRAGKSPLEVLKHLMKCGVVLATHFDLDSAGTLDTEPSNKLPFDVLYATVLDPYSVSQVLEVSPERTHVIERTAAPEWNVTPAPIVDQVTESTPEVISQPPVAELVEARRQTPAQFASPTQTDATVRLNVALLDTLMSLAGELVLGRNQLNEAVRNADRLGIRSGAHRISLVTSELQETVSLTRMQPVSSLFSKFPRLVRDLAKELGKEIVLNLEGGDVELDKTILEGLSDPLNHMVRNSVDHGIEPPAVRLASGKRPIGNLTLRAKHQAGQVVIEIVDDGKGISGERIAASAVSKGMVSAEQVQGMSEDEKRALIFLPGLSTAEKLTNVSGRGVGMDVVKTNLDKLGGKVEIESVVGAGSTLRVALPLTLAIIPSLLVSESGERFAIPQVSVGELIRIPANQIAKRIDHAGDAELLLLRDRLVPLVHLAKVLGCPVADAGERALNIVLVDTGSLEYGLVVGDLHDTVEIVVKPMGRHLQGLRHYAGATILGDGQVAVILDAAGLAASAGLNHRGKQAVAAESEAEDAAGELLSLLLFQNAPGEHCAVPIELVTRVERVQPRQIEQLGGRRTMQYGDVSLPVVTLHDLAKCGELNEDQQWVVVVFQRAGHSMGLLVAEPLDMIETHLQIDTITLRQPGIAGSALLNGRTTMMLDIFELAATFRGRWPEEETGIEKTVTKTVTSGTVLVAEDSAFFRGQIKRLIEAVGYKVLAAEDGQEAWEILNTHASEISVVTTDVEMPRLDGLALTRRIRADSRFTKLPIIALSTLAGEEEMARGLAMGVSEYQVKLDQGQLLESIGKAFSERV
jgi:two-component system chemotaxis sensor kinase CheA